MPVAFRTAWWRDLLPFAAALAKQNNGELHVLVVVRQQATEEGKAIPSERKEDVLEFHHQIVQELSGMGVTCTVRAQLGANVADTVLVAVEKLDADLLLMPYEHVPQDESEGPGRNPAAASRDFRRVLRESRCDLLIFNKLPQGKPRRILVPVAKSNHNRLLGNVAWSLAAAMQSGITLLHAASGAAEDEEEWRQLHTELNVPERDVVVNRMWVSEDDVPGWLPKISGDYDLVLMGAKKRSTFEAAVLGPTAREAIERSPTPVFVCYTPLELPALVAFNRFVDQKVKPHFVRRLAARL
jgi:nucleotide-binding universal stress UspA family protein